MKKFTAVACLLAILLTMAGCSAARTVQKLDAAEERVEAKLDAAEEKLEDSLRQAVSPAAGETRPMLTEEEVQKIALEEAGLSADQITGLRTQYEVDDGVPQFDVSFYEGDWEYEFEIHAETGKILSYDQDHKYD